MRIEIITNKRDLAAHAIRWDELALMDPRDGFFRTYVWYTAWMEHIRPDATPFVILVRDAAGTIAGIAPLCRASFHDLGFRVQALRWAGREVVSGDFLDILCAPGDRPAVTAAIVDCLAEERTDWGLLLLGELIAGGESYTAVTALAARCNLPLREQEARICPYIALPDTFDQYLETLGSSTRYHVRRRMRDVEKRGAAVNILTDPREVATALPDLVRLHLARWRSENLPGTLGRPGFSAFLRHVCLNPGPAASARLYMLTQDGAPAAALLAFHFGHSALYYQAGWDPHSALAALSPAVVLMGHSIREAIKDGKRFYEFLRGDEAYKSRWTTTQRTTTTLVAGRGFMAKQYLRVAHLKDNVKPLLRPQRIAPVSGPAGD
ncbi:MAG: GNAT family N-acetyltransferase [Bryobacteraceae bacterium]|nr:GNAT family N-acetyltransferase [Bryobacteraceae bacterium]